MHARVGNPYIIEVGRRSGFSSWGVPLIRTDDSVSDTNWLREWYLGLYEQHPFLRDDSIASDLRDACDKANRGSR